jgi:hypothetical protein
MLCDPTSHIRARACFTASHNRSYNLFLMLRSIAPQVRCVSKHERTPSFETFATLAPQDEDRVCVAKPQL